MILVQERKMLKVIIDSLQYMLNELVKPIALTVSGVLLAFLDPGFAKDWVLLIGVALTSLGGGALTWQKVITARKKLKLEEQKVEQELREAAERHVIEQIERLVNLGFSYEEAVDEVNNRKEI